MKREKLFPLLAVITVLVCSCHSDNKPLLSSPTGKPGEVLLICDPYILDTDLGKYFKELMGRPFEAIPQNEPIYDLIPIPTDSFTKIFKTHRNIIIINISRDYTAAKIIVQRNVWASQQLMLNVAGPAEAEVLEYLKNNGDKIIELLDQSERARTIDNYKRHQAKGIDAVLREKYHVSVSVPTGYTMDVDSSDFIWLSHEIADLIQGVLIYFYDYTDPNTFTPEYLINKRNEFTKKYVPGPVKNSYMIVEDQYPVMMKEMVRDSTYVVELRGLWKLENAFMGGPFISFTSLDEKRNRIVTVEGFVHAPSLDKRIYVRELEAILYTFSIIE
jgi:hypothetical protein